MSFIVSLVGAPAAGKSSFAKWFVDRNPIYLHLDVAAYRARFGALIFNISNTQRIVNEIQAWNHLQQDVLDAKYALVESTGLPYRLQHVYNTVDHVYIIKFLADKKTLESRIIERSTAESELELMCLDYDLMGVSKLQADTICSNIQPNDYPSLEALIHLATLEQL